MKDLFDRIEPGRRRLILTLAVLALFLLVSSSVLGGAPPPGARAPASAPPAASASPPDELARWQSVLDQELATLLDQVAGAGPVAVAVTLGASPAKTLAEDVTVRQSTTNPSAGQGASSTTETDRQVVLTGGNAPVVLREVGPSVQGVLVVARGAARPLVREELRLAVETVLGVPAWRVLVLPREGSP